jgi:hypothetical protein
MKEIEKNELYAAKLRQVHNWLDSIRQEIYENSIDEDKESTNNSLMAVMYKISGIADLVAVSDFKGE